LPARYSIIIRVNKEKIDKISNLIKEEFPNSQIIRIGKKDSISKFLIKLRSGKTKNVIKHEIEKIEGVSSVEIGSDQRLLPKFPRKFSTFLMAAFIITWVGVFYLTYLDDKKPLDSLTNSQLLFIEITIAVGISVWIFMYDRKSQQEIIDVLSNIDLATSEVRENVKDLVEDK